MCPHVESAHKEEQKQPDPAFVSAVTALPKSGITNQFRAVICTSRVMQIRLGFTLLGEAPCQSRVCSHVRCVSTVGTGGEGGWGPTMSGVLLVQYGRVPPNRGRSGSFVEVRLSGCETRGDSDRSVWDTAAPCRIKQAASRAPVTGNLTQITKGSADRV